MRLPCRMENRKRGKRNLYKYSRKIGNEVLEINQIGEAF